jgi:hypothetical protein
LGSLNRHDDVMLYPREWFGDSKLKSRDALQHHRPELFRILANHSLIKKSQRMTFCEKQAFHFHISVYHKLNKCVPETRHTTCLHKG